MNRRGFATLAALWVLAGTAVAAAMALLAGREATALARNRVASARIGWIAEGCIETARVLLDSLVRTRASLGRLAQALPASAAASPCRTAFHPAGHSLDVNAASAERLRKLLRFGASGPVTDSLADALLDWRDGDDEERPFGAEATAYRRRGEPGPRNGPLADARELLAVRGFATDTAVLGLLGVERGRTPLDLAPLPVIASLPGVTPEVIAEVARRRRRGEWLQDIAELAEGVSRSARDSILARFGDLAAEACITPDAWLLHVTAADSVTGIQVHIELRLVPAQDRMAIVRRRSW